MIEIQNRQRQLPVELPAVRRAAELLDAALALGEREASVLLISDRRMRELNRRYRQIDRPTNVLAFAQDDGPAFPGELLPLGDVLISIETARREAAVEQQIEASQVSTAALTRRVVSLMIHGLLHLSGHDHRDDAEEEAMEDEAIHLTELVDKSTR
jgi:probable rRNA maturation factor